MTFGTCRYCGQVVNLDYEEETQAEADIAASEKCECYDARHERNLRKQITAAQNRIRKIFGDDAAKLGFSPIAAEEPLQLLNAIAEQTARGFITSATINVRGLCKAKITMTTTVSYIHPARRYCILEFAVRGGILRESFQLIDGEIAE